MTGLVLVVFAAVYLGMAIGRWPGLKVDHTGIERARDAGVVLTFAEHARCGVPMTLLSFLLALAWLALMGHAGV